MKICKSSALKKFKNEIGQANHFLITTLIGLDGVKSGEVKKNDEFDAAWNPKDVIASANRSRIFVIKSALSWIVDCLDMYLRLCNRRPKLINEGLSRKFDGTGHSVYQKYLVIVEEYEVDKVDQAVIDLLICWRNRMVHFDADNKLQEFSKKILKCDLETDERAKKYHLNSNQMLKAFEEKKCPTFKEIAFLISKAIEFIEKLDQTILSRLNIMEILDDTICYVLKRDQKIFDGIFSKNDIERRRHKIIEFMKSNGFMDLENNTEREERYINSICQLSYKEAKEKVLRGTFLNVEEMNEMC